MLIVTIVWQSHVGSFYSLWNAMDSVAGTMLLFFKDRNDIQVVDEFINIVFNLALAQLYANQLYTHAA
jgi:hypothetical protein